MKKYTYLKSLVLLFTTAFIFAEPYILESKSDIAQTKIDEEIVQVWGTPVSPYVRKVISVLEEKQISYKLHQILPEKLLKATNQEIPALFKKASVLGKIPAVQIGNFTISDSSVIIAYLEKKCPLSKSVYPIRPNNFAQALWYEKYADTVMTDIFHKIFFEKVVKKLVLNLEADEKVV